METTGTRPGRYGNAADPCARCRTRHGYTVRYGRTPERTDGAAFGRPGERFCRRCFDFLRRYRGGEPAADRAAVAEARRALEEATREARREAAERGAVVPPCAECGTTGGNVAADSHRPERISGKSFGRPDDLFCRTCYTRLRSRHARPVRGPAACDARHARRPAPDAAPSLETIRRRAAEVLAERERNRLEPVPCYHAPEGYRHDARPRWEALAGLGPLVAAWHARSLGLFTPFVDGQRDEALPFETGSGSGD